MLKSFPKIFKFFWRRITEFLATSSLTFLSPRKNILVANADLQTEKAYTNSLKSAMIVFMFLEFQAAKVESGEISETKETAEVWNSIVGRFLFALVSFVARSRNML